MLLTIYNRIDGEQRIVANQRIAFVIIELKLVYFAFTPVGKTT